MLALAQRFFCAAALMKEAGALKCCCGVICRHGQQQLVDLVGEVGATARGSNQTAPGTDTDGNDNAAARLRAPANVGNDFPIRNPADDSEVTLEPFRK